MKDDKEDRLTCTLSNRFSCIEFPLLFDPTQHPVAETCIIDGIGFTARRLARKMEHGGMEYRVFMADDVLDPWELSSLAAANWKLGFCVATWNP